MNFLKMSPLKFFALGAGITLALNLSLYVSQLVSEDSQSSITKSRAPQLASKITRWLAGNADEAGSTYKNGMGMTFVKLPDMDIGFATHEVTREQFRFFAESVGLEDQTWLNRITKAGITQPDDHPIVNISWEEANQFCQWLSKQEGIEFRLPTDYEWSIAAGLSPETSFLSPCLRSKEAPEEYFWGKTWSTDKPFENYADKSHQSITGSAGCFAFDDGFPATAPVGSFLPNQLGIYDMGGNVSEWVYDWYRSRDEFKTVRGASYGSGTLHKEVHYKGFRAMSTPAFRSELFGFRIVAEDVSQLHPVSPEEASIEKPSLAFEPVSIPDTSMQVAAASIPASMLEGEIPLAYSPPVYDSTPVPDQPAIIEPFPTFTSEAPVVTEPIAIEKPIEEPVATKNVRVTYTGKDGINIRSSQSFGSSNKLGAVFAQSAIPLSQTGDDARVDTETWVKVEATGWLPTKNSTHTYLKNQGNGTWKVVWNKAGDRYVSMRSKASSESTLISKVNYGTVVEELDTKKIGSRHYVFAKFSGWVVKKNSSRSYISDL